MAERRMFAKTIIDSDAFLDMPASAQALYFHLAMRADDDGFINNPRRIQRTVGSSSDDLKLLIAKQFIIPFDSGIVVIKHWRIHNYIQSDRYKGTFYQNEKAMLKVADNKAYELADSSMYPECIQDGYTMDTQVRLGKESIGKDSLGKDNKPPKSPLKGESVGDLIEDFTIDEEVKQALKDFVDMRRSIKKPITPRGMKQVLSKLRKLSARPDIQVKILEQSIEHDWQTVYELKTEQTDSSLDMMEEWLRNRGKNDS